MTTLNRINRTRRGFTLIEAIVIVIIIGVLAAVIAPRLFERVGQSKQGVAVANAATLRSQVELFQVDAGRSVSSSDTIRGILWERPSDVSEDAWRGPYVSNEDELLDPWGNEFALEVPGQLNKHDFDVVSYGADGSPGGEDENKDIRQ